MSTQEDFIGIYENAYSQEYCDALIKYYESMSEAGFTINRQEREGISKTKKQDDALYAHSEKELELLNTKELIAHFNNIFWLGPYKEYSDKFDALKDIDPHKNYSFKIQKTEIGGGYHIWHCEAGNRDSSRRLLAWTLYLNDIKEGGETEFLYQHKRIKPKTGTLVLWPAAFTHTHRGNPPLSNTKYIVTGWVEF
jgi:hypothetical protein